MNDPRVSQHPNYPYSSTWGGGRQYPSSSNYSYQHGARDPDVPHHQTEYGDIESLQIDTPYQDCYYTTPSYQHSNTVIQPTAYHLTSPGMSSMRDPQSPHHSSHSHSQAHVHTIQSPYPQVLSQSQSPYPHAQPRSNSQAPTYIRAQTIPTAIPPSPSHYSSQAISISPQYPASPTRPFTYTYRREALFMQWWMWENVHKEGRIEEASAG
ncbi:hypothetical protein H2248_004686 [Termitomyces sp. 'cryptogamus']|nr:hypothetical protein H2248_004686 [Termitomyces sp. 'cryptogamus']